MIMKSSRWVKLIAASKSNNILSFQFIGIAEIEVGKGRALQWKYF